MALYIELRGCFKFQQSYHKVEFVAQAAESCADIVLFHCSVASHFLIKFLY